MFQQDGINVGFVSLFIEMGAYETIWLNEKETFKSVSERFKKNPDAFPSEFVSENESRKNADEVVNIFRKANIEKFGVRLNKVGEYPEKLQDSRYPVELLYFRGWWNYTETPCISIVGTRNPSSEGLKRVKKLTNLLIKDGYTIVSGLAKGIDTEAHKTALREGVKTIAVIGTPLSSVYPKENADLQNKIAEEHLVISQVPVLRYQRQDYRFNRLFFLERNITMSALTSATIIVEAGETSGTLTQAKAALEQGRKLFILDNCFKNPLLTWPKKFAERGAIRLRNYEDLQRVMNVTENSYKN